MTVRKHIAAVTNDRRERERLRSKGQFWTPPWVADAMVAYALPQQGRLLDPAVGPGAFTDAALRVIEERGSKTRLCGVELDPKVISDDLPAAVRAGIRIGDFLSQQFEEGFEGVVSNPPYMRHHRLPAAQKAKLRDLAVGNLGAPLDGRTGLHAFFLIRCLELLKPEGRLAFILPADVCEGVYAGQLWQWIASRFRLEALLTFAPHATPFPGVDTNPIILFVRNDRPQKTYRWAKCTEAGFVGLKSWVESGFRAQKAVTVRRKSIADGLSLGFSRPPIDAASGATVPLGRFFQTRRGIASGANEFFLLDRAMLSEHGIPEEYTIRVVGRTRDVTREVFERSDLQDLEASGRPTYLLALNGEPPSNLPATIGAYLAHGEALGLPQRPLIQQRSPWYRMERRDPPPLLFAYLGRRNARFIRNKAGVVPLTSFLCVYPRTPLPTNQLDLWWKVLQGPWLMDALRAVGKTYGGGAVKVEPRALEKLQIPLAELTAAGLATAVELDSEQASLY